MKKILLSIVALGVLWSCSNKPEEVATVATEGTQTLTISLANNTAATRMIEAAATTDQLKLNNGHIFILNAQNAVEQDVAVDVTAITSTAGQTISTKVSSDSRVYIVANIAGTNAGSSIASLNTLDKIDAATLTLKDDEKNYATAAMANENGNPVAITTSPTDPTKSTAAVTLVPLFSRIELAKVTGDSNITSFDVAGVYVDSYYGLATLAGLQSGDLWSQSQKTDFTGNIGDAGTWSSTGTPAVAAPANGQVWAYHVASAGIPRLIVKLANVHYNDANAQPQTLAEAYLTVKSYTDAPNSFERGKVYTISNINFTRDNLAGTPNITDVALTVTATVTDWSMQALTPTIQ